MLNQYNLCFRQKDIVIFLWVTEKSYNKYYRNDPFWYWRKLEHLPQTLCCGHRPIPSPKAFFSCQTKADTRAGAGGGPDLGH